MPPGDDAPVQPPSPGLTAIARHVPRITVSFVAASLAMVALAVAATVSGPMPPLLFAYPVVVLVAARMGAGAGAKTALFCVAWLTAPWLPTSAPSVSSPPLGWDAAAVYLVTATALAAAVARWRARPPSRRDAELDAGLVGSTRMLRVMALAALLPFVAFAIAGYWTYGKALGSAGERADRMTRIAQEHASKVFDTSEAILGRVLDRVRSRPDSELRTRAEDVNEALKEIARDFPQVHSIWIFGADGRPVATDRATTVQFDSVNVSERDYFRWHLHNRGSLYISEPHVGKASLTPFFDTSRRREDARGRFLGTASVSLSPEYFARHYEELALVEPGLTLALIRRDGVMLVRNPPAPAAAGATARAAAFTDHVATGRAAAVFTRVRSSVDGVDRVLALRAVDRYPVYVTAAISHETIIAAWQREMTFVAAVLFPMSAVLVWLSWVAYRRSVREARALRELESEIRSRAKAEEALLRAQKMEALGMLTGSVAHDFNNVLAVVANNAVLVERTTTDARIRTLAAAIRRAVRSGSHLTRQLLSFSRSQALRPVEIDLRDTLPNSLELLRATAGRHVAVSVAFEATRTRVKVDEAELELALINLAVNARDAMPHGGRLEVRVSDAPVVDAPVAGTADGCGWVAIAVTDTGTGMPESVRLQAFEPLFTTKAAGRGTGLGLSQVWSLCQQAGGTARIESRVGEGTTVTMLLPALAGRAQPRADPAAPQREARLDGELLLVEDNPEVSSATKALLESLGLRVTESASAGAALELVRARDRPYDVVLCDIRMPGEHDGLALARRLRALRPEQPVLLTTGYASDARAATAAGFEVLAKPCAPETLAEALARALADAAEAVTPVPGRAGVRGTDPRRAGCPRRTVE